jgi:4-hydroxybenzoate polyprenyltransferase
LHAKEDANPLGKRWIDNFLRRNFILKTKRQFHIDSARVNSVTTEIIRKWFQKLALFYIKTIKPENRWNMNEAEIMKGMRDNGLVVGSAHKRFIQKKTTRFKSLDFFY